MSSSAFTKESTKELSCLHFVLLHHGYHGRAQDFYYLSGIAEEALNPEHHVDSRTTAPHFVFLHPSGSDRLRTEDGVVACAKRYINHACKIIEDTLASTLSAEEDQANKVDDKRTSSGDVDSSSAAGSTRHTTPLELRFSAVGHSMGGLILRAAFPHIMARVEALAADNPRVRSVHWDAFCTMAAPHLGVHYMRSPVMTFLGGAVGHHVSQAIADLFSKNALLTEELVTAESLAAWARFKRRVILSVVNDGTVLVYSSSFVMPVSVRKRIGAALPERSTASDAAQGEVPPETPEVANSRGEPSEPAVADAARGPSHDKDHPNPDKHTTLDVPNTDASVVHLAQHGIHCASSVDGLRRNAYELKELSEDLWPAAVLPEPRALAQRILQAVGPLELHLVDFRPLRDAPLETLPKHVAAARAELGVCGRMMTHLGAHRFSHAAMACKSPFYYPEFFGFPSEYVVTDLLGIPLNINGLSSGTKDAAFTAV